MFKPPQSFIKASEARQAALRQKFQETQEQQQSTSRPNTPGSQKKQQQQQQYSDVNTPSNNNGNQSGANRVSDLPPISPGFRSPKGPPKSNQRQPTITSSNMPPLITQQTLETTTTTSGNTPTKKNTPTTTSTTHKEIERIKAEREDRRRKHAEIRKRSEGLTEHQKTIAGYRFLIDKFRNELNLSGDQHEQQFDRNIWQNSGADVIKVVVRKRPLNSKESQGGGGSDGNDDDDGMIDNVTVLYPKSILVHEPKAALDLSQSIDTHTFQFDATFGDSSTTEDLYKSCVDSMVKSFVQGNMSTVIAYGQTGSGKTYTVFGSRRDPGIVILMLKRILSSGAASSRILTISFYEVYGNKIYDLLQGRRVLPLLEAKTGGCVIQGLREYTCERMDDCFRVIDVGMKSRITAATEANPMSSRSHAVMQIRLYASEDQKNAHMNEPGWPTFSIVDLAGSEKASEANVRDKLTIQEGADINKSLLALKECIRALNSGASHVPFRASKLTLLLRDSLDISATTGSSDVSTARMMKKMVLMCATVKPAHEAAEHTLNTLRYANRLNELTSASSQPVTVEKRVFNIEDMASYETSDRLTRTAADSTFAHDDVIIPSSDSDDEELAQQQGQDRPRDNKLKGTLDDSGTGTYHKGENRKGKQQEEELLDSLMLAHLNCLQNLLQISQQKEEMWLSRREPLTSREIGVYCGDLEVAIEEKLQQLLRLKEDLIFFQSQPEQPGQQEQEQIQQRTKFK